MKKHAQVGCVSVTEERCPVTAQFINTVGMSSALEVSLLDINGNMIGHAIAVSDERGVSDVQYYHYELRKTLPKV